MLQRILLVVLFFHYCSLDSTAEKDSTTIAFEKLNESLANEFESFSDRKTKKIIRSRLSAFKNEAGIYLPMLVLSNTTYLASPPVLYMIPVDSIALKRAKSKEAKEIYFIRKCLDDPEISLHNFRGLLYVYYKDYANQFSYENDWLNENSNSFLYFKLACYHLLSAYFPKNASFKFIIGRWHYNYAIKLINDITDYDTDKNIEEIQEESAAEMRIALPWFKEAARLYNPFESVYLKILEELGLKE